MNRISHCSAKVDGKLEGLKVSFTVYYKHFHHRHPISVFGTSGMEGGINIISYTT